MRLAESQIKAAILHPDCIERSAALRYFTGSFTDDPTVLPLAIEAITRFGWEDAFDFYHQIGDLAQTADTLGWVLDQVARVARPVNEEEENRRNHLSSWVANADTDLLLALGPAVAQAEGLTDEARQGLGHRLELVDVSPEECWRRLEAFCEAGKDKQYINEVDLPHARRLAEGAARGRSCADRALTVLSHELDDYTGTAAGWLEPLAAMAAGRMRLAEATPLLKSKLWNDGGDLLNEECAEALIRIGGDATVEQLCGAFLEGSWHYRLYASGALSDIHSDLVVKRCLELLDEEQDGAIRDNLTYAVLANFDPRGIEPARQRVLAGSNETRRQLVGAAALLGVDFPELADWRELEIDQLASLKAFISSFDKDELRGMLEGRDARISHSDWPGDEDGLSIGDAFAPTEPIVRGEKTGRNEPCPCGSGKKFKKCCGRAG